MTSAVSRFVFFASVIKCAREGNTDLYNILHRISVQLISSPS